MARTSEFDREQVLENAMLTFWENGYTQTSIPNLVEATKLNPGSIYAAFESKQGLFLEVLEFYGNRSFATLQTLLMNAASPLQGIEKFFSELINKTQNSDDQGCLVVNTLLEMSSHNSTIQSQANKLLAANEAELLKTLEKAKSIGEISPNANTNALAKYLMINIWGLRVLAKTGTMQDQTQSKNEVLEQIMHTLKT